MYPAMTTVRQRQVQRTDVVATMIEQKILYLQDHFNKTKLKEVSNPTLFDRNWRPNNKMSGCNYPSK